MVVYMLKNCMKDQYNVSDALKEHTSDLQVWVIRLEEINHFDYTCVSWYPGINKQKKSKLQVAQNKMIRFILNLNSQTYIG